jgi:hypothetical protein
MPEPNRENPGFRFQKRDGQGEKWYKNCYFQLFFLVELKPRKLPPFLFPLVSSHASPPEIQPNGHFKKQ